MHEEPFLARDQVPVVRNVELLGSNTERNAGVL